MLSAGIKDGGRWMRLLTCQISQFCAIIGDQREPAMSTQAGMRGRTTLADVMLGNKLVIEMASSPR